MVKLYSCNYSINMKPMKQNQAKLKQSTTKSNVFSEGNILFFKSHKIALIQTKNSDSRFAPLVDSW